MICNGKVIYFANFHPDRIMGYTILSVLSTFGRKIETKIEFPVNNGDE